MHLCRNNIIGICLILLLGLSQGKEQKEMKYNSKSGVPFFYYDAITYPVVSRDSVKLEILIKVPFDAVQFLKRGSQFIGEYEISVLVLDENEVQAASKIWRQKLVTESFQETSSREHFDVNKVVFTVQPSKLRLTIGVLDLDTKKSSYRKKNIDLKDFYKNPITLSNINIIEKEITDETGKSVEIASAQGTVTTTAPTFSITFDVLSDGGEGQISYKILDPDEKVVLQGEMEENFQKGISHKKLTIPKDKLSYSKYKLQIAVKVGKHKTQRERSFQLRWVGMSSVIDNLDDAIEQLRYIADNREIREMSKANPKTKKNLFMKFWKKRDPSPNTDTNELMNEYYKRIRYANEHFSGFLEGWKTDMGMIFVLFGPPNDIERHPFEIQTKPYEIWYYYDINRTFVFVDETGFGDYRLITPYYDIRGMY